METALNTFKKPLFLLSVFLFLIFWQWLNSPMIITVTGSGEVSAPAESATVTFTVSVDDQSVSQAVSLTGDRVNSIKESLTSLGIAESNIYESEIATYPTNTLREGASGFTAVSTMGIKTNGTENIEKIIPLLYEKGATLVSQPVLSVDNTQKLEADAFNLALKDAKKRANAIALKNLKFLKKIVLVEQTQTQLTTTVTTKADVETQVEQNISPESRMIKIQKTLSVSYKMW